jgi:hypothetical protein
VDVIDPARRQLLVSTVVEEETFLHLERDLFCVTRVSGDGAITFDVYRLSVTRPGAPAM